MPAWPTGSGGGGPTCPCVQQACRTRRDRLTPLEPLSLPPLRGRGVAPLRSLCRHFRQIVSRSRGTLAFNREGGAGSWEIICSTVSVGVCAERRPPVSNSYRIAPRAYTSAPPRWRAWPRACSGHVARRPECDTALGEPDSPPSLRASPKSVIFGVRRRSRGRWPVSGRGGRSARVGRVHGPGQGGHQSGGPAGPAAACPTASGQTAPVHQLHREVRSAVRVADVIDLHHAPGAPPPPPPPPPAGTAPARVAQHSAGQTILATGRLEPQVRGPRRRPMPPWPSTASTS